MGHDASQLADPSKTMSNRSALILVTAIDTAYIPSFAPIYKQLERTEAEANENEENVFPHHRCSPEVGNLSWHQNSNYQDRRRYRTIMMAIVGPRILRVLGKVAHRGPVSSGF